MINNTKSSIPSLRFPEFTNEWEMKRLDKVASIQRGRFSPRPRNDPRFYGGDIPFVQTGDVVKSSGWVKSYTQTLNEEGLAVSKLFPKGTILMTIAANIGHTGILTMDMASPDSLVGIIPRDGNSNVFLNYYLSTQQEHMDRIASQAAQKNINIEFLNPYSVAWTSVDEQQKIADFLTAVDDKIITIDKKVELMKQYKKGIMQQIFSQNIHFKDENENNYPAWRKTKLEKVLIKNSSKNKGGIHKLVQSVSNTMGFVDQTKLFKDHVIASKDLSNYYVIKQGTFAYNPSRIDVGSLAYKRDDKTSVVSPLYVCFRADNSMLVDYFLLNWLSTSQFSRQMNSSFEGSVRNTLSYDALKRMEIYIPTLEEQQKIASFLSRLDDKIVTEQTRLTAAREWKKGLMQRMFA